MWNVLYFVQRSSIHTIHIRAPLALVVVAVVAIETKSWSNGLGGDPLYIRPPSFHKQWEKCMGSRSCCHIKTMKTIKNSMNPISVCYLLRHSLLQSVARHDPRIERLDDVRWRGTLALQRNL